MNSLINKFNSNYPRTTAKAICIKDINLPEDIAIWVSINVSLLMAKLKRGDYSQYMRDSNSTLPDNVVDMFGYTYLQNVEKVIEQIFMATGEYSHIKNLKTLQPDNFFKKLINQESK
jgi:hypothetical protein